MKNKLTDQMYFALMKMEKLGRLKPENCGLSIATFNALKRRGLAKQTTYRTFKISVAGQEALALRVLN